jgi:hypothetical protein
MTLKSKILGALTALGLLAAPLAAHAQVPIEFPNAQTGTSYTVVNSDQSKLLTFSNAAAVSVTLPQAGIAAASGLFMPGWYADFQNQTAFPLAITSTTSTIGGAATYSLPAGQGIRLISDGTNYQALSLAASAGSQAGSNILQNGDFAIDQQNEGASATLTSGSVVRMADRWMASFVTSTSSAGNPTSKQVTAPAQFTLTPKVLATAMNATPSTTVPAALILPYQQFIEGEDMADLGFGNASGGTPVTVSGWAMSSIASATYGVALQNATPNRSYVQNCTTSATPGVWTKCTFTIPADTAGTWTLTPFNVGGILTVTAACGSTFQQTAGSWQGNNAVCTSSQTQITATASAIFQLGAWKVERGSVATAFVADPGTISLAKARRFYKKTFFSGTAPAQQILGGSFCQVSQAAQAQTAMFEFDPPMFASPTVTTFNPVSANANWRDTTGGADLTVTVDPVGQKGNTGVMITSATASAAAHNVCIQATFDALK